MRRLILLFLPVLFLLSSCSKDRQDSDLYGIFQVEELADANGIGYPNEKVKLRLNEEAFFQLYLTVNECSGELEIGAGRDIVFEHPLCTQICCDSESSERFVRLISDVKHYAYFGNHLVLTVPGEGYIKLERSR